MSASGDFVIADIAVHLAASKNRRYRENTVALYKTLTLFLQRKRLTHRQLLAEGEDPGPMLRIMRSDLTDEGFDFIRAALHEWVRAVMAGKVAPTDADLLEERLVALRSNGPQGS